MHLLLVEDDLDLGNALQKSLAVEGLSSEWIRRAADAPADFAGSPVDAVLLDVCLPDGSGFDLLRQWRQAGVLVPIIVITARGALADRLAGLDGGADDFVIKPFVTAELVSRLRAVMRRYAQQACEVWRVGALEIEPARHVVRLQGERLALSPREFRLVLEMAREPGRVVPKDTLAQRLEPLGDPVPFATIDVHISNLRRKLGPGLVRTVRGVGYALQA